MHRTALLLMVGSGILLTAGNGTDAYPIVGYSQAVAASEDSTGILLEQSVQGPSNVMTSSGTGTGAPVGIRRYSGNADTAAGG